jgi:WhiB family redox-sensing transcriptional regulator
VIRRSGQARTSRIGSSPLACAPDARSGPSALELELRVGGAETVGVWGALNEDDRRALHAVWSRRRRAELEDLPDEEAP